MKQETSTHLTKRPEFDHVSSECIFKRPHSLNSFTFYAMFIIYCQSSFTRAALVMFDVPYELFRCNMFEMIWRRVIIISFKESFYTFLRSAGRLKSPINFAYSKRCTFNYWEILRLIYRSTDRNDLPVQDHPKVIAPLPTSHIGDTDTIVLNLILFRTKKFIRICRLRFCFILIVQYILTSTASRHIFFRL